MKRKGVFLSFPRPVVIIGILLLSVLTNFNAGGFASACVDPDGAIDIMGAQATLHEGAVIRVPINVRNAYKPDPANKVNALGFDVVYDTQVLDFVAFEPGELMINFTMVEYNEVSDGVIRVGGFSLDAPLPGSNADPIEADEEGVLGYLIFKYLSSPQCTVLTPCNLVDHIASWSAPPGYLLPGSAPTADAGEDRNVIENSVVTLDGSDSFDPDGDITAYLWEQTGGISVSLSDPAAVQPNFTVPGGAVGQALTFVLTVTDEAGLKDIDTVTLTITADACTTAPAQPVLIFPANGATEVSLSPTLVTSEYSNPGECSSHWKTRWQISDQADFAGLIYNVNTIYEDLTSHQVTKMVLKPDTTYYWQVRYWGDNGLKSEWSDVFSFTTESDSRDSDGNGVPDDQEADPATDLNENGIPDSDEVNLRSLLTADGTANIGIDFSDDVLSVAVETMSENTMEDAENLAVEFPYGAIAFRVDVPIPGLTVNFAVHLQEAAPANALWYKYDSARGWYDFTHQVVFSADRKSLSFMLTDGGAGDADGLANGIITDPAGLGVTLLPSPNLINWNGNLVADFGANGLWYHNGTNWNWMTNRGHVNQMVVWDGKLVVDFGSDYGLHYYDGTGWTWMSNKGGVNFLAVWNNGATEKLVVDFGGGRRVYTYNGAWSWLNNKDDVSGMIVWNNKLIVDFGAGRGVYNYDTSWHWMTNKDDVTTAAVWDNGSTERLVVDFGGGRRVYTYNGAWSWLTNKDDVNAMEVWDNRLVVDFGSGRGVYNYDTAWHWMTNKDGASHMVTCKASDGDKLAVDFGGGRGMYYYDGSWNWMKNTDTVPEMISWGERLAVDFGPGTGVYNYDGAWNFMKSWSTAE